MAVRTRVEIRTPTGKTNHVSPERADELRSKGAIKYTDRMKLYAIAVMPIYQRETLPLLSRRSKWTPIPSGYPGPLVMQLV